MSGAFDYVIVGAGAAGCVLANRLSADPGTSVLLVEAGGTDTNPVHLVPKGFYFTLNNPRYAKAFTTQAFGDGHTESLVRGRVLGGSTTINGMVWNRGWAPYYDAWEAAGNKGWNWARFVEAYRRIERHQLGGNEVRGGDGPVDIEIAGPREEACDALIAAMERHGIAFQRDMNASGDDRVSYVASNIRRGTRMSAAKAFLRPARRRANLSVATHTEAETLVFSGSRVTGIRCRRAGGTVTYSARKEVLVAGGAFDSPLLLERSGIGNPDVLAEAGVPVVVASPKVGENFKEHRGILLQYRLTGVRGYNAEASSQARYLWTGFKYLFSRSGMIAHGGYAVSGIYRSDPDSPAPDTQCFFTPISTSAVNPMTGRMVVDKHPGAKYVTYPLYPTSTGSLHITGPGLDDAPRLEPNFLSTEHDRAMLVKAVRRAREIVATEPFARFVAEELQPGPLVVDDADIVEYGRNKGVAGAHGLGTCAIGPAPDDVVDASLRVRGADGLRVVDASVFRDQPSGNNNAPTMALAWIAADIIRAENG
ncbi:GMC family oxidoreductase N-terminal domain-containing protein [Phytohabitans sp. ZYX-F-186]|uniref:GMC family oxidoreductase N-terminal domain-containing protein n=1 Tax=Phytohabitans maris TaxID=3071409 RepID=A0ABU0ZQN5_9ACTN|nr:GMC family oxidoreductase N-terminal domain-containing protein [Phytohabitans sp. ZYX-F-186]MDQ7909348.1 GMC family oxidoreductase N-terminal domain-containing protein [Phytohabitans sp. ZYX-F-186]